MLDYGIGPINIKVIRAKSERALIISKILEVVNNERKGTKFKPATPKFLGIKLAHIPTQDLYFVFSVGMDYKKRNGSFSKYLFGSIKVQNERIQTS